MDITSPGTYTNIRCPLSSSTTIAAGTVVSSHLLHAEKNGDSGFITLEGSVTFDAEEILGVIVCPSNLVASDWLGAAGTTYPNLDDSLRSLRGAEDSDVVTISSDRRKLTVKFVVFFAFDQIRVITADSGRSAKKVEIDIKPGSDPNSINLQSQGVIPVAILSTDDFDATTVDGSTVTFGPARAIHTHDDGHLEDVDEDGDLDWVGHFRTQETGLSANDTSASISGRTKGGLDFIGTDAIKIVSGKEKSAPALNPNPRSKLTTTWARIKAKG